MATEDKLLQLHPNDNVAVARTAIIGGEELGGFRALTDVPAGHKIALRSIAEGERVLKYGQLIGMATRTIVPGEHVHSHNIDMGDGTHHASGSQSGNAKDATEDRKSREGAMTFRGFRRANGRVGTRNYIGVLTTVNCSATVAKRIAAHFTPARLATFSNVDGVVALTHSTGCGMSGTGKGADVLRRTIAGYATHPNFAGVLLLGLGCEVNQASDLVPLGAASRPQKRDTMHPELKA